MPTQNDVDIEEATKRVRVESDINVFNEVTCTNQKTEWLWQGSNGISGWLGISWGDIMVGYNI